MSNEHKAGFVNIIGNPNVGKSTLMNRLVGEKLAIITPKAQTTRHRILGIVNTPDYQMVFSDTPGIIKPAYGLQESMMGFVKTALKDADVLLYMVEPKERTLKDSAFFKNLKKTTIPLIVAINKIDLSDQTTLETAVDYWKSVFPQAEIVPVSALENFNIDVVLNLLIELIPVNPPYFPKDQLTDKPERFFVNEIIREKILLLYKKEIPYSVEIETEAFIEDEKLIKIRSIIMVERDSQKGILIGHKGAGLKKTGTLARKDMEQFFGKKVFLELYVKVNKNWRNDKKKLKRFGYK